MNAETLEKLKSAASLACTLRNLLEEVYEDIRYDHVGLSDIVEDLASRSNEVESDLDDLVESQS